VAEQQSGLRFDIYERVHLAEGLPELKELESIELIPHIQIMADGEQALLKGNLWLTGQYISGQDDEIRTLEHWIPVEITLPLNRVHRLEDIAVQIENFDVDLLSPRTLNVTGVLSLQGIEVISTAREDWQEEEVFFAQETEEARIEQVKPAFAAPKEDILIGDKNLADDGTWLESVENKETLIADDITEEAILFEPNIAPLIVEDRKDVKVAFTGKPPSGQEHVLHIKNLLNHDEVNKWSSPTFADNREPMDTSKEGTRGDELEWKKLFLGEQRNERQFQKLRLCIVQKEETIDGIAKRYSINPREILLYNGLNGQQIAVGQVIYIPS
jgi:stage VI sporulation protein D